MYDDNSYMQWACHPETNRWYKSLWIADYYAWGRHGASINGDMFKPDKLEIKTMCKEDALILGLKDGIKDEIVQFKIKERNSNETN